MCKNICLTLLLQKILRALTAFINIHTILYLFDFIRFYVPCLLYFKAPTVRFDSGRCKWVFTLFIKCSILII